MGSPAMSRTPNSQIGSPGFCGTRVRLALCPATTVATMSTPKYLRALPSACHPCCQKGSASRAHRSASTWHKSAASQHSHTSQQILNSQRHGLTCELSKKWRPSERTGERGPEIPKMRRQWASVGGRTGQGGRMGEVGRGGAEGGRTEVIE